MDGTGEPGDDSRRGVQPGGHGGAAVGLDVLDGLEGLAAGGLIGPYRSAVIARRVRRRIHEPGHFSAGDHREPHAVADLVHRRGERPAGLVDAAVGLHGARRIQHQHLDGLGGRRTGGGCSLGSDGGHRVDLATAGGQILVGEHLNVETSHEGSVWIVVAGAVTPASAGSRWATTAVMLSWPPPAMAWATRRRATSSGASSPCTSSASSSTEAR